MLSPSPVAIRLVGGVGLGNAPINKFELCPTARVMTIQMAYDDSAITVKNKSSVWRMRLKPIFPHKTQLFLT